MVAVAVIGASVVGAGASVLSGNAAAKAQTKAADQQVAEYKREYDTTRADFAPWRTTGVAALGQLSNLYGLGSPTGTAGGATPTSSSAPYGGFFTSPGYQFRVDEGNKAIQRSAAARGILGSGATLKAMDRFTQDTASAEYDKYVSGLMQLSGFGQSAAGSTAAAGATTASGIAGAYGAAGNARASSYLNTGNAINGTLQNVAGIYAYGAGGGV